MTRVCFTARSYSGRPRWHRNTTTQASTGTQKRQPYLATTWWTRLCVWLDKQRAPLPVRLRQSGASGEPLHPPAPPIVGFLSTWRFV